MQIDIEQLGTVVLGVATFYCDNDDGTRTSLEVDNGKVVWETTRFDGDDNDETVVDSGTGMPKTGYFSKPGLKL